MIKKILDKDSDKCSAEWDYNVWLEWLWSHESQCRPEVYE